MPFQVLKKVIKLDFQTKKLSETEYTTGLRKKKNQGCR